MGEGTRRTPWPHPFDGGVCLSRRGLYRHPSYDPHVTNQAGNRLLQVFERIGADPDDTDEIRLKKRLVVAIATMISVLAVAWVLIYLAFDEPLAASIPGGYAVASTASTALFAATRRFAFYRASQLVLILLLPFFLMIVLGGFVNSSAVVLWSLIAPMGALLIYGRRQSVPWFVAYAALVALGLVAQPLLRVDNNLTDTVILGFFVMNIVAVSLVTFVVLQYFVGKKDEAYGLLAVEQDRSERLLLNVLPEKIAQQLKTDPGTIANSFESVSILFADIVGFTPMSHEMNPEETVELLNRLFSYFDSQVERLGIEKIRSQGDSYMAAAGIPTPRPDHAAALADLAIEIRDHVKTAALYNGHDLDFRIGINSGPAVAGVIGSRKFQYDVWGDAVNVASRMESHGVPGRIQISDATRELIKNEFVCTPRGEIEVKGKGLMRTWFLEGRVDSI